ncbi:MAG: hypothetical protein PHF67_05495 [Candidatus Nanoarchaeia archaeon]|nr:hypothetical protein [Candidatus Nanoarchaeia archaeon]
MNLPLDKIQYKHMLDCPGCRESSCIMTKAYTKRYLGEIWIKFDFVCNNCGYPFLLNATIKLSDEEVAKMKKENYNLIISPKQETRATDLGPVPEIDCSLKWI